MPPAKKSPAKRRPTGTATDVTKALDALNDAIARAQDAAKAVRGDLRTSPLRANLARDVERLVRDGARVRGMVQAAGDDAFDLLADDGSEHKISYAEVVQARTVFEWGPEPKGGKAKAAKGRKQEVVRR